MVQKGQTFLAPSDLREKNYEKTIVEVGPTDDLQEGQVRLNRAWRDRKVLPVDEIQENLNPQQINEYRPEAAREADNAKDAPLASSPLQWASNPDHFDFPGVDTGPQFREEQGDDFDTDSFLDEFF